jgi:hypothetical protein
MSVRIAVLVALCLSAVGARADSSLRLDVGDSRGTGVLVLRDGEPWLLTAYHVLREQVCAPGRDCVQLVAAKGQSFGLGEVSDGQVCVVGQLGLAAARVTKRGLTALSRAGVEPARLSSERIAEGDAVIAIGNPTIEILGHPSAPFNYVGSGQIAARSAAETLLPASALIEARKTELLLVDGFTITYGFSGGPLFRSRERDGQLLGLVQGGDAQRMNRSWAIPADLIHAALPCDDASKLGYPFAGTTGWPNDGFAETHEFKSPLRYATSQEPFATVTAVVPRPLTFHCGTTQQVTVQMRFADPRGHAALLVLPKGLPGVEHVEGIPTWRRATSPDATLWEASWGLGIAPDMPAGPFNMPFEVRDAMNGETITSFEIPASVLRERAWMLGVSIGADFPIASDSERFTSHATLRTGPVWPVWERVDGAFALQLGVGPSLLIASQRSLAPLESESFEEMPTEPSLGLAVELLAELRIRERSDLGLRFGVGARYEGFWFDHPYGASGGRKYQGSFPVEITLAVKTGAASSFLIRTRVAYCIPPTLDWRYAVVVGLDVVDPDNEVQLGIDLGWETNP